MERLTYKEGNHYYSENDCLVEISTIDEDSLNVLQNMLDKLGAYEDAEEHGRYGKWIPVSERLPEESLNSVIGWDTYRNRCCFVQYLGGRFVLGDDIYSVNVTAWMPLPEPYRES